MGANPSTANPDAAELFGVLALACDSGVGLPAGHTLRTAMIARETAARIGLASDEQANVYLAGLLKDAGCTSWTTQVARFIATDEIAARREFVLQRNQASSRDVLGWMLKYVGSDLSPLARARRLLDFMVHGRDFTREGYLSAVEVANRVAVRLELSEEVQLELLSVFEHWDGDGLPRGIRGQAIPVGSRIIFASIYAEVFCREDGPDFACDLLRRRSGTAFDPAVAEVLVSLMRDNLFSSQLHSGDPWELALAQFPADAVMLSGQELREACALTIADFVGMKSHLLAGHPRRVAALAEAMANKLGLQKVEVEATRLAALTHDLGLVGVPSYALNRPPDKLDSSNAASLADHPARGAELVGRATAFSGAARIIRTLGGWPEDVTLRSGAGWAQTSPSAIVMLAGAFDCMTHDRPRLQPVDRDEAIFELALHAKGRIAAEALEALRAVAIEESPLQPSDLFAAADSHGLTAREIEVLKLAATGLTRKEIAKRLFVAESTLRHHLESIYGKLGVTTRVAAVLRAMEAGLLD